MAQQPDRDREFMEFLAAAGGPLGRSARQRAGNPDDAAELLHEALVRTYLAWRRVGRDGAQGYAEAVMGGSARPPATGDDGPAPRLDAVRVLDDAREAARGRRLGWTVALLTIGTVLVAFGVPPLIAALVP